VKVEKVAKNGEKGQNCYPLSPPGAEIDLVITSSPLYLFKKPFFGKSFSQTGFPDQLEEIILTRTEAAICLHIAAYIIHGDFFFVYLDAR
jgi:hypothetical protein